MRKKLYFYDYNLIKIIPCEFYIVNDILFIAETDLLVANDNPFIIDLVFKYKKYSSLISNQKAFTSLSSLKKVNSEYYMNNCPNSKNHKLFCKLFDEQSNKHMFFDETDTNNFLVSDISKDFDKVIQAKRLLLQYNRKLRIAKKIIESNLSLNTYDNFNKNKDEVIFNMLQKTSVSEYIDDFETYGLKKDTSLFAGKMHLKRLFKLKQKQFFEKHNLNTDHSKSVYVNEIQDVVEQYRNEIFKEEKEYQMVISRLYSVLTSFNSRYIAWNSLQKILSSHYFFIHNKDKMITRNEFESFINRDPIKLKRCYNAFLKLRINEEKIKSFFLDKNAKYYGYSDEEAERLLKRFNHNLDKIKTFSFNLSYFKFI